MTNRDFKYWLHGFMEISSRRFFTSKHIVIITDHLKIVDDPDSFTNWLEGVFDAASVCGGLTSHALYCLVEKELDNFFDKQTPIRKDEISEAVDEVLKEKEDGVDYQHMTDILRRERENMQLHHDLNPYRPRHYYIGGSGRIC